MPALSQARAVIVYAGAECWRESHDVTNAEVHSAPHLAVGAYRPTQESPLRARRARRWESLADPLLVGRRHSRRECSRLGSWILFASRFALGR